MYGKISLKYYVQWLFEQYKNLARLYARQYPFKIVDREISKETGKLKFVIKVENRMSYLKMTASEVIEKSDLLEGFSKNDIQIFTYQFFLDNHTPQYGLIGEKRTSSGISILLKDNKSSIAHVRNVQDFKGIKKFISKLNPKSAFRVGYLVGSALKTKPSCKKH